MKAGQALAISGAGTKLTTRWVVATSCMSALGHQRTFHALIRHVRFSAGTRPRNAIG